MSNELTPTKDKPLTGPEFKYLQALEMGLPPTTAIKHTESKYGLKQFLELARQNVVFIREEERIVELQREELSITREKIQAMVMDAVDMAKVIGDPNAIIRAAAELNKMCGFYAPETKIIELGAGAREMRNVLESMDDNELLKLLERDDSDIIDIEFEEVQEVSNDR